MANSALNRLESGRALLCIIDVQERLTRIMQTTEPWRDRLEFLAHGARVSNWPIFLTEQNPEKLGPTSRNLEIPDPDRRFAKTTFSCYADEAIREAIRESGRDQIVLAGIETHICVQATGLDLLREGFEVFLAADACSSRLAHTGPGGVDRLRAAGAVIGTAEGFLFEALDHCEEDRFRALLPLVRESR